LNASSRRSTGGASSRRRALTHVGGPIAASSGTPEERALLEHAMDVAADEDATRAHIHGFHSYPARLHPLLAHRLVTGLCDKRATVLDPFCGSGTVLVESRLLGRAAIGVDANPLAVALARFKVSGMQATARKALLDDASEVGRLADERRARRQGASMRYPAGDVELFEPHVLLELDSLRLGIRRIEPADLRAALELVLSSILIKVSRQPGDTSAARRERRLAGGFTTRLFLEKTDELVQRFADYEQRLPPGAPDARVFEDDARKLQPVAAGSIDLVVTSPPYPGTYDYLSHHAARLRWLGMPTDSFDRREIGARRRLEAVRPESAMRAFRDDFAMVLGALGRVCRGNAVVALVVADSVLSGRPIYAEDWVREAGRLAGFRISALASQARPHFHRGSQRAFRSRPRGEHVILLRREARVPKQPVQAGSTGRS
jgi:hypothetical protein